MIDVYGWLSKLGSLKFLSTLNIRRRIINRDLKGTMILTTTHLNFHDVAFSVFLSGLNFFRDGDTETATWRQSHMVSSTCCWFFSSREPLRWNHCFGLEDTAVTWAAMAGQRAVVPPAAKST